MMYVVRINNNNVQLGQYYAHKTLQEALEMVLKLSEGIIIRELSITMEEVE